MIRVAYCVVPEAGGLYRFYQNLRSVLAARGIDVLAFCAGQGAAARWNAHFADDGCHLLAPDVESPKRKAQTVADWVHNNRIDILMPMDDPIAASVVSHLPERVRLVTRCSSGTSFAFRTCVFGGSRLSRVVATTPRQQQGIARQRRLHGTHIELIPNGVDITRFAGLRESGTGSHEVLRLAVIGRLDDSTKGIFWIPQILTELVRRNVRFSAEVIGDGPDRTQLLRLIERNRLQSYVKVRGEATAREVACSLANSDVLVLPSRIEGSPNVLMESMAAGAVPVASRIGGVTDFIVEAEVSGMLCPVGHAREFADRIGELAQDRDRLRAMSVSARWRIDERFSLHRMGYDYAHLFEEVMTEAIPSVTVRPWSRFRLEPAFTPGWRRFVPRTAKNFVRKWALS